MAEIINLRRVRKAKARDEAVKTASANRAIHGRTKAERVADAAERSRIDTVLRGARLVADDAE